MWKLLFEINDADFLVKASAFNSNMYCIDCESCSHKFRLDFIRKSAESNAGDVELLEYSARRWLGFEIPINSIASNIIDIIWLARERRRRKRYLEIGMEFETIRRTFTLSGPIYDSIDCGMMRRSWTNKLKLCTSFMYYTLIVIVYIFRCQFTLLVRCCQTLPLHHCMHLHISTSLNCIEWRW